MSTATQILRTIAWPSIVAVLTTGVLGLAGEQLGTTSAQPVWLSRLAQFFVRGMDAGIQANLYATIAQIAGVFLGLYFTALSVVASTSYRDVPADLRSVVVEERAGTIYLKVVAYTGASALICLGALSAGWSPGVFNVGALAVLSAASILSFVVLGLRVFTFFDPGSIATYLSSRIVDSARASTPRGYAWTDQSFQSHQQRIASRAANALRTLVGVTSSSTTSASSVAAVAKRALATLAAYASIKPEIPAQSYWFERVAKHESWLTASGTSIEMAVRSGAGIQPKSEPDQLWLETQLIDAVRQALLALLTRHEYEEASGVLQRVLACVDALAERFQLDVAVDLHSSISSLLPLVLEDRGGETAKRTRKPIYRLAVVDGLVAAPCSIVAATGRAASKLSVSSVRSLVELRSRSRGHTPIGQPVSRGVRSNLQFFGEALDFERDAEGKTVTTEWFIAHHVGRVYCIDLRRAFEKLLVLCESTYTDLVTKSEDAIDPEDGIIIIQRGREAAHKLQIHGEMMQAAITRLESLRRTFGEQDWTQIDVVAGTKRARTLDVTLLGALARVGPTLSTEPPTGEVPDSRGFALTTLANELFSALVSGECELFAQLFQPYLVMGLQTHDRARLELAERDTDTQLLVTFDLLLEMAELSGYAYLISNSIGGDAWPKVRAAWDRILSKISEPKRLISLMLVADTFRSNHLATSTPRDFLRTGWSQNFMRVMSSAHFGSGRFPSPWDDEQAIRLMPIDPLTHAFLRHASLHEDARNAFFVAYLAARPEAADIELPGAAQELAENRDQMVEWRAQATRDGSGPLGDRTGDWRRRSGRRSRTRKASADAAKSSEGSTAGDTPTAANDTESLDGQDVHKETS
ncbi:MAG TPA: hypothetical protein VGM50_02500 [Gemmatimonadaceae bacterium]|jgi:hypothetical protein